MILVLTEDRKQSMCGGAFTDRGVEAGAEPELITVACHVDDIEGPAGKDHAQLRHHLAEGVGSDTAHLPLEDGVGGLMSAAGAREVQAARARFG